MGYGITVYRVSLQRLCTRLGTQDKARKNRLREVCLKRAKNMDSLGHETTPSFMEIVEELLDGKATYKTGYLYWYAIQSFVDDLGVSLANNHWYPASAEIFWDIKDFVLYEINAPMKIPQPDDFPLVFVLKHQNMKPELQHILQEKIQNQAQLTQFQYWIKEAQTYKQDLILYYH